MDRVKNPWASPKASSVRPISDADLVLLRGVVEHVQPSLRVGHKSLAATHVVGKLNAHLASDGLVAVEFVGLARKQVEALCNELALGTRGTLVELSGEVAWFYRSLPQLSVEALVDRFRPV